MSKRRIASTDSQFFSALEHLLEESKPLWGYKESVTDDYFLQDWVGKTIGTFEQAVTLIDEPPFVKIAAEAIYQIELLKSMTWEYVIDAAPLSAAQEGQRRLIAQLFDCLEEWLRKRSNTVPVRLRDLHALIAANERQFTPPGTEPDLYVRCRAVSDFLCTLTEPQVIDLFQRVTGVSPANVFGGWL